MKFTEKTMKNWKLELTPGRKCLADEKIQRGIFLGDVLSPLLFVLAMAPLNHLHRKYTGRYKLYKSQEKINHLMYINNIKLFTKNEKELELLIQAVRIYSQDTGMEFGREKYVMQIIRGGKRQMTEENQNSRRKGKLQVLGDIEKKKKHYQTDGDERKKLKNEYIRRTRTQLETKLYCRNLIKGINTWVVRYARYSRPFLK